MIKICYKASNIYSPREKTGSKYFVWQGVTDLEVVDLKPIVNDIFLLISNASNRIIVHLILI